jgi:hypothetical protein
MTGCFVCRLPAASGWGVVILVLAIAVPLQAQDVTWISDDSSGSSVQPLSTRFSIQGALVDELPVDRPAEVLLLQPGVTANNQGELLIRGGRPGDASLYLDGVPILSASRSTPFFGLSLAQSLGSELDVGPNAVGSIGVTTGPLTAAVGNGQSGAIDLRTLEAGAGLAGSLNYETDEPFGSGHSFGVNRVQGELSGALTTGLTFSVAGLLHGQRSRGSGVGSEDAPIFVSAGVDTIVAVPSALGDPLADTTRVSVYDFAVSRGRCEDFASSADPGIAGNYRLSCRGARTPSSTVSSYDMLGKLSYSFGSGSHLSLVALASQDQNRNFEYGTLYNTAGLTGNRSSSRAFILSLRQPLIAHDRTLSLDAHVSFQTDRALSGPLAPGAADGGSEPFGGFMLAPLDLRFDLDNFPVDDELIRNYRTNQPGSRRSPYDLENPAQYSLVDQYRNNAYGLYNRDAIASGIFPESGGPLGPLTLYRENRTVGSAAITWQTGPSHQLQAGGEFTRYSVASYFHLLDSQAFSDVYSEHPVRGALFLQDKVQLFGATVISGIRYDWYNSRARRPADFPRISSHPLFDPAQPDAFFSDNSLFPEDRSHGYASPHIQASFPVRPGTVLRAGFATQAQVPDFREILLGINTDLSITNTAALFGSDLDFEHTSIFEFGVHHILPQGMSIDLAVYARNVGSQVVTRLVQRFDPLAGIDRTLRVLTNDGSEKVRGIDLKLERQRSRGLAGSLAYSYQDAKVEMSADALLPGTSFPSPDSRPHSFASAIALNVPDDWKQGSTSGAILRSVGLFTTFRVASGTPYTSCPGFSGDASVLSPDLCTGISPGSLNKSRLPTFKQLDIRLTKRFGPGGRFTGYLDARNALNFRNVLAVFAVTGTTDSPLEADANWRADSADYANEATASSSYQANGSIDLGAGQSNPRAACGGWIDQGGTPASPNCIYLIRAEERFGNGDHVFDLAEQRRASDALYLVMRGTQEFTGPPRRVRVGLEVTF